MTLKKGVVHLVAIFVIIAVAVAAYFIYTRFIAKKLSPKQPKVELKTEYKNPFNKDTQFVNPFDKTKNPFAVAK